LRDLRRDQLTLVNDGQRREAAEIKEFGIEQPEFFRLGRGALANYVQLALERLGVGQVRAARDEDLADCRHPATRDIAARGFNDRHVAPPEQPLTFLVDDSLE